MITIPLRDSLRMVPPFATMYQAYILRIMEWSLRHFSETIKLQFGGKCHALLCLLKLLKFLLLNYLWKRGAEKTYQIFKNYSVYGINFTIIIYFDTVLVNNMAMHMEGQCKREIVHYSV